MTLVCSYLKCLMTVSSFCNVRYVPELKRNLLCISMFDDLDYYTKVEHGVLKISPNGVIMSKRSKIFKLYILDGSNVIGHSSLASEDFYDKNKLWYLRSRDDRCPKIFL